MPVKKSPAVKKESKELKSKLDTRKIIKKNVEAIHISTKLNLLERKLFNALLYNAYENMLGEDVHTITVQKLTELIDFDSNNTKHLEKALKNLVDTSISWDFLKENQKGRKTREIGASSLLSFYRIEKGVCVYQYSEGLKEKLYNPVVFACIELNIQKKFSSKYSLSLYENCYRFKNVGKTGWIALEVFKKLLGAGDEKAYEEFKIFNNRILKPAIKEVNDHSNITIEPSFQKSGRKISDISFSINENILAKPANEALKIIAKHEEESSALLKKRQESKSKINDWIKANSQQYKKMSEKWLKKIKNGENSYFKDRIEAEAKKEKKSELEILMGNNFYNQKVLGDINELLENCASKKLIDLNINNS